MTDEMTPGTRTFLERGRREMARQGGVCPCGGQLLVGWIGDVEDNCRVGVCETGEHVLIGHEAGEASRVYIHVENPADVIETSKEVPPGDWSAAHLL